MSPLFWLASFGASAFLFQLPLQRGTVTAHRQVAKSPRPLSDEMIKAVKPYDAGKTGRLETLPSLNVVDRFCAVAGRHRPVAAGALNPVGHVRHHPVAARRTDDLDRAGAHMLGQFRPAKFHLRGRFCEHLSD